MMFLKLQMSEKCDSSHVGMTEEELNLVHWEEWALSMEEHYHALELFHQRPNGPPMGHR